jgi:hypothetical protein
MFRSFTHLITALLLAACAGLAHAGQEAPPALDRSQSLTYVFSYDHLYTPMAEGGSGLWIDKDVYQFEAPPDFALTGKMNATVSASYERDDTDEDPTITMTFDVLVPRCGRCGMFDSDLVGTARGGALSDDGTNLRYATYSSIASGLYSRLLVYQIIVGWLPPYSGYIQFHEITFTAEMVSLSPVPELPPLVFLILGLAVLGVSARVKAASWRHS